jgi:hypothetical protein
VSVQARLFLATLLAISLINNGPAAPQAKAAVRESVTGVATEVVHDRIQTEVPRIITWRQLPVATPATQRRARPRAARRPRPTASRARKSSTIFRYASKASARCLCPPHAQAFNHPSPVTLT